MLVWKIWISLGSSDLLERVLVVLNSRSWWITIDRCYFSFNVLRSLTVGGDGSELDFDYVSIIIFRSFSFLISTWNYENMDDCLIEGHWLAGCSVPCWNGKNKVIKETEGLINDREAIDQEEWRDWLRSVNGLMNESDCTDQGE